MLQRVGLYLTQNRSKVVWVALLCALLPLIGVPIGWINIVLIGLITLCHGNKEGLIVLGWSALPAIAFSVLGRFELLFVVVLGRGLIVWLGAMVLRKTASWTMTIQCMVLIGIAAIISLHMMIPNLSSIWLTQLTDFWNGLSQSMQWANTPEQKQQVLQFISQFATGIVAVTLLGFDFVLLILARGWQASLMNPKGLAKELCQIRMGLLLSLMLVVCVMAAFLDSALAKDILPLLLLPFVIAGLSVIHAKLADKKEYKLPALIGLYVTFVFCLPYMAMVLAFLGFVDSWFDFRALRKNLLEVSN